MYAINLFHNVSQVFFQTQNFLIISLFSVSIPQSARQVSAITTAAIIERAIAAIHS